MKEELPINEKTDVATDKLLVKYFGGNATESEMLELEKWIAASHENEAEFMRLTKLYEMVGLNENVKQNFNTDKAKANFDQYISERKITKKNFLFTDSVRQRKWYFVAAIIALLITVSNIVWRNNQVNEIVLASNSQSINSILPDDTEIILSTNSSVSYKSDFAHENKELMLKGKAQFNVGKSGNGKLRISADETFIEDIGTKFEVSAYPQNDYVQVKVNEGLVKFYTAENKGIIVRAHETGLYDKRTKMFRILANYSFKNGTESIVLNLDGLSLAQAAEIISNAYGVRVQLVGVTSGNKQITVSFADEKLETVLQIMSQTLGLSVEKSGSNYYLKE